MMFRIARMLGKTVNELSGQLDYPELLEWAEFLTIEPEPEWRADARAAQICATLANINRNEKKRAEPYSISEFLLKFKQPEDSTKPEQPEAAEGEQVTHHKTAEGAKIATETLSWLFAASRKITKQGSIPNA
jgi:hypothetical protein